MASFIAPLIGLGISGISSLFGGSNPISGQLPGVQSASGSVLGNVPSQLAAGTNTTAGGVGDISQAGKFFQTILAGSKQNTEKLLGPQVNTIVSQYDNAAKSAANLGPRGGGRTGTVANLETGKVDAYGKLLGEATPGAASGLGDIGAKKAAVGTQQTGQVNSLESSVLNQQGAAAGRASDSFANLGTGIGSMLVNMLNGKKSGGSSSPFGSLTTNDSGGSQ